MASGNEKGFTVGKTAGLVSFHTPLSLHCSLSILSPFFYPHHTMEESLARLLFRRPGGRADTSRARYLPSSRPPPSPFLPPSPLLATSLYSPCPFILTVYMRCFLKHGFDEFKINYNKCKIIIKSLHSAIGPVSAEAKILYLLLGRRNYSNTVPR